MGIEIEILAILLAASTIDALTHMCRSPESDNFEFHTNVKNFKLNKYTNLETMAIMILSIFQ